MTGGASNNQNAHFDNLAGHLMPHRPINRLWGDQKGGKMGELIILLLQIIGVLFLGTVCLALVFGISVIVVVFGRGFKRAINNPEPPRKKTTKRNKTTKK